jgi:hypothetical protein
MSSPKTDTVSSPGDTSKKYKKVELVGSTFCIYVPIVTGLDPAPYAFSQVFVLFSIGEIGGSWIGFVPTLIAHHYDLNLAQISRMEFREVRFVG